MLKRLRNWSTEQSSSLCYVHVDDMIRKIQDKGFQQPVVKFSKFFWLNSPGTLYRAPYALMNPSSNDFPLVQL